MKKELWLRLKHYHFDDLVPSHLRDHVLAVFSGADASTQAFASKLARKLGWSRRFAFRAIDEYRKFVFLGLVSEYPVTPPRIIDQVWHEHLLFSKGYREFCRTVLRRDFDHNPELVPVDEQTATFQAQYVATLDLYREEFRVAPPVDIWGTPKFSVRDAVQSSEDARERLKRNVSDPGAVSVSDNLPLYLYFDGSGSNAGGSYHSMPEFGGGGGGGFSGAGGGSSWGESHGSGHGADSSSGGDSGGGDSGGDGGGGSGCSSGCGGGGCGGG